MGESTYCAYPNDHEMGTFTMGEGKQLRYDVYLFTMETALPLGMVFCYQNCSDLL